MIEEVQKRTSDASYRDRRVYERFEINLPGGCLNYQGTRYPCHIVDVSLSGCCVRTESKFLPGNLAHVEIVMPILGLVLRMVGTIQWLTRENLIGIRFFHASARSKNQLAGLLTGLVDSSATEAVMAAVEAAARSGTAGLDVKFPKNKEQTPAHIPEKKEEKQEAAAAAEAPPDMRIGYGSSDGVWNAGTNVWPAMLQILKDGSILNGSIVGLSQEGCSFQFAQRFIGGTKVRVEVEFQMLGLPFRLVGVIEDIHQAKIVEVRFLEMSSRKRDELTEVINELRETAKKQAGAEKGN